MLLNGTGPLDASTHAALENYKVFIRDQDTKMKVTEDTANLYVFPSIISPTLNLHLNLTFSLSHLKKETYIKN